LLGFNAAAGLLAVITTIVGAAVGANLVLISFDISRSRSARAGVAALATTEALEVQPSTS